MSGWLAAEVTCGDLVAQFVQRALDLHNALTEHSPAALRLLGVRWVTKRVRKAGKWVFGPLPRITAVHGGLFHRQGNSPSHGFAELGAAETHTLRGTDWPADVDQDSLRLVRHRGSGFAKGSGEDAVNRGRWITEGEPRL